MLASDRFYCRQVISLSCKPSSLSGIGTDKSTLRYSRDATDVHRSVPWPWKTYLFPVRFYRCSVYHIRHSAKLPRACDANCKTVFEQVFLNHFQFLNRPEESWTTLMIFQDSGLVRNKGTISWVKVCQTTNINFAIDNALNKKNLSTHVLLTRTRPHTLLVFV